MIEPSPAMMIRFIYTIEPALRDSQDKNCRDAANILVAGEAAQQIGDGRHQADVISAGRNVLARLEWTDTPHSLHQRNESHGAAQNRLNSKSTTRYVAPDKSRRSFEPRHRS